ncbi:MAG: FAD-binding protein [Candidatus Binatia bacterium]
MHIVVCCKGVPNEPRNFALGEEHSGIRFDADSVRFNESDEYAVDQAVLLKKFATKATAITLGHLASQEILYGTLAKGADDAVRVNCEAWSPAVVAVILGMAPRRETGWAFRKIVRPKVYIACGISGESKHMAGMIRQT